MQQQQVTVAMPAPAIAQCIAGSPLRMSGIASVRLSRRRSGRAQREYLMPSSCRERYDGTMATITIAAPGLTQKVTAFDRILVHIRIWHVICFLAE